MKLVATIKLKIKQTTELIFLRKAFHSAIQYAVDAGFKEGISNRFTLHHLVYKDIREQFKLPANFTIEAIGKASSILKSVKALKSKTRPIIKRCPISFNRKLFTFQPDSIRCATINARTRIDVPITIPACYMQYLDWKYQTMQLIERDGKLFAHITFSREVGRHPGDRDKTVENASTSCGNENLGIDLGINNLAVTSDCRFFNSSEVKQVKRKFKYLRSKLQAKDTRSAKRLLKKLSGREQRFMAWVNHNISKSIVSSFDGNKIIMEDLKGIRKANRGKRMNYWISNWSFFQLQGFVRYKAERRGIEFIKVKPHYTSQLCHRCGSLGSRSSGSFACLHCGLSSYSADLNAARNLAHPKLVERQATVTSPYDRTDDAEGVLSNTVAAELTVKSPTL